MGETYHDFSDKDSFKDRITHILCHLQEKQQSIKGIFSGECGDLFMRYFKEYLYHVFERQMSDHRDTPRIYRLNHAVSSFAETVRWWLKEHSGYSPEEISRFLFRLRRCIVHIYTRRYCKISNNADIKSVCLRHPPHHTSVCFRCLPWHTNFLFNILWTLCNSGEYNTLADYFIKGVEEAGH